MGAGQTSISLMGILLLTYPPNLLTVLTSIFTPIGQGLRLLMMECTDSAKPFPIVIQIITSKSMLRNALRAQRSSCGTGLQIELVSIPVLFMEVSRLGIGLGLKRMDRYLMILNRKA